MADVYNFDTNVKNKDFLEYFAIMNIKPGSIIIMHCPEAYRRCNLDVIEKILLYLV